MCATAQQKSIFYSCFWITRASKKLKLYIVEVCSFITQNGWTALMSAAANGKCDVVTELISLGADIDIQNNVSFFIH